MIDSDSVHLPVAQTVLFFKAVGLLLINQNPFVEEGNGNGTKVVAVWLWGLGDSKRYDDDGREFHQSSINPELPHQQSSCQPVDWGAK